MSKNKWIIVFLMIIITCSGCYSVDNWGIPTKPQPSAYEYTSETPTFGDHTEVTNATDDETDIPIADISIPSGEKETKTPVEPTVSPTEETTQEPTEPPVVVTSMEAKVLGKKHYIGDVLEAKDFEVTGTFSDGSAGIVTNWAAYPLMLTGGTNVVHVVCDGVVVDVTVKAVFRPAIAYDKRIICIGDSLTEGAGGETISYEFILQNYLDITNRTYQVINRGGGGELNYSILARMGVTPIFVEDFVLPDDTSKVEVKLFGEEGADELRFCSALRGMNNCWINNIECFLTVEEKNGQTHYYLNRIHEVEPEKSQETEEELEDSTETVEKSKKGTLISGGRLIPNAAVTEKDAEIYICWIGTNSRYYPIENHLEYQKRLQQYYGNKKVLFLGLTCPDTTEINERSKAYWGEQFLDLKEELLKACLTEPEIELTEEDLLTMEEGELPDTILYDEIHLNAVGYKLVGRIIYEYLIELGWI